MTETKAWYESKTVWINVLLFVGAVCYGIVGEWGNTETALTLASLINIVLRALTTNGLSLK